MEQSRRSRIPVRSRPSIRPYLSKPLRCKEVSASTREDKKDKAGWDALCRVLDTVQSQDTADFTHAVLVRAIRAIHDRLGIVRIMYPVPNRISLEAALRLLQEFLSERTGGIRFESIAAALFVEIGRRFGMYSLVRRTAVNSADSQSGAAGDIECLDANGVVVAVVEAKDRQIAVRHVQDKLPTIREVGIQEAFFLTSTGADPTEAEELRDLIAREFASGQNLYVIDSATLFRTALSLFGEAGRRDFLCGVGSQLDEFARLSDRQRWAALLGQV